MRLPNARLVACAVAASIALGSVVAAEPALAAPIASCTEPHAAKVARSAVKATMKVETTGFAKTLKAGRAELPIEQAAQAKVLADATSTDSAKGIAAADVTATQQVIDAVKTAQTALVKVAKCGLPAMKKLAAHAKVREAQYVVDLFTILVANGQSHLQWDTVTRDSFQGVDADKYATWNTKVQNEQAAIALLNKQIAAIKKKFL